MNLQQLEYVLALNKYRNYKRASEKLFITQPALTIQIKNFEEELGLIIFDRSKKPLEPTEAGIDIIEQISSILKEKDLLFDIVQNHRNELSGNLSIGIIPTVAPYIIPYFIAAFSKSCPNVELEIYDLITEEIITSIKERKLDAGIIATPYDVTGFKFEPLYYEKFYALVSEFHSLANKNPLDVKNLNSDDIWLLKEGNCFRNQVINVCKNNSCSVKGSNLKYNSQSIDSLIKIVEAQKGLTIIPELAKNGLSSKQQKMIREISPTSPVREISIIYERTFIKRKKIETLKQTIIDSLPEELLKQTKNPVSTSLE